MPSKMIPVFLIFIFLVLVILLGGHYLVYKGFITAFQINNPNVASVLKSIYGFLAISYVLGLLIAHWSENFFTRTFYFMTAAWLGTSLYIAFAVILGKLVYWLTGLADIDLSLGFITAFLIGAALFYSGYGIWNAFTPGIKKIEVAIKNLPQAWQGKMAVQISDVHLGHIHGKRFLHDIITRVNSVNPSIVLITGDLFDGMGGNFGYIVDELNRITAPQGIYYIIGNHETYMNFKGVLPILAKTQLKILRDQAVTIDGLQIIGADYPEPGQKRDITKALALVNHDLPSILLWHEPIRIKEAKESNISLMLSGHTHHGQLWPFGLISRLAYKKYHTGLHSEGDFSIYTSIGAGTWGPPMRTGNKPEIVAITLRAKINIKAPT